MEPPPNALPAGPTELQLSGRAMRDLAFGSAAGMISKVFEHPFDLCKVRLQAQVLDSTARFAGPLDCLTQTWKYEGVRGLYRGLPAPVVGAMLETACLFFAYGELQNLIRRHNNMASTAELSIPQLMLASGGAGALTSFILTPIELVKCKMQVQMLVPSSLPGTPRAPPPSTLPGPISVLMSVVRQHGVRGLWLGHTGTFIREAGGGVAWFTTKEYVATSLVARRVALAKEQGEVLPRRTPPLMWESALAGASAGIAYNLALFPADTVKSAVQTEEELRPRAPGQPRPTYFGMAKAMYAKQGIRGLYSGCGITIARSVPSSALVFALYDGLRAKFA